MCTSIDANCLTQLELGDFMWGKTIFEIPIYSMTKKEFDKRWKTEIDKPELFT
jgi:hypothetical protein